MSNRPTLEDVARLAGVSAATVSRSLTRPDLVNLETLDRVRLAAERLGYVPTGAAQALASGRTRTIGAIVPTLDSAIFARTLQSLQSTLAGQGYQLLVASNDYNPAAETAALRALLARGVDGLFLVGTQRDPESWRLLERAGVPAVLTLNADPRFDGVVVDNRLAGRLAAEHLIGLGHRAIGVVTGRLAVNDRQRDRVDGIRAALEAAGGKLPGWRITEQPMTMAGGRSGCAVLLAAAEPPTAIVCGIDILAIGCLSEAHERGIAVPDSLSVVGIDNLEMSANVSPALTTVHIPTDQIGERAARTLLLRLAGRPGPTIEELPVELVVRRSSARARSAAGGPAPGVTLRA